MSEANEKYVNYSAEDFVWDEQFRAWVNNPTPEVETFWSEWLNENPQRSSVIDTARQVVQSLQVYHHRVAPTEINNQIEQILLRRDRGENPAETARVLRLWSSRLFRVAAVFILLAGIGLAMYLLNQKANELNTITTASGIQKRVSLPDSSSIVMNSNSKLVLKKHWGEDEAREIWMEGEGYFEIKHLDQDHKITNHERFLVHTNGVIIEVLGTTFNIRNRRNKTEIVLKEGKIRLSFDDHKKADMIMAPDEIVTIDNSAENVSVSTTAPDDYSAWIHGKLILKDTHLSDIIQYLEDNYSKKIITGDTSLLNKRIDGTLMLDNLDDALFILSKVLKVKIQQNDTSIYFIKM
jgi:ferric-dicitrate binding protein FerR (iron transport regulator)